MRNINIKGLKTLQKVFIGVASLIVIILIIVALVFFLNYENRKKAAEARGPVQIAVFGDSIWDLVRDETGIEAKSEKYLFGLAEIYNCSIMGSAAAKIEGDLALNRPGLTDMSEALVRKTYQNIDKSLSSYQAFSNMIPEDLDYIILAYGLNDYFSAVPISNEDPYDKNTYQGALRYSIRLLQQTYPDTEIIVVTPTYCQLYSYGKVVADSFDQNYGGGTGEEYAIACREVAKEMDVTLVDMFQDLKINRRNGLKYLIDATHLTEKGRDRYARILTNRMIDLY